MKIIVFGLSFCSSAAGATAAVVASVVVASVVVASVAVASVAGTAVVVGKGNCRLAAEFNNN